MSYWSPRHLRRGLAQNDGHCWCQKTMWENTMASHVILAGFESVGLLIFVRNYICRIVQSL